ncbi:DUF5914 domain-containing protein [Streptomyces sp. NBC_01102]|uniref:DUF5914 domain-containing protein n=1 Tax=Streptomyces sp. NBC_01102 TaxID=2903749 RepID=UPI003862D6AD|nr:DUF5914 domain-containing protein [Streptomyces sp. NBC_01102]
MRDRRGVGRWTSPLRVRGGPGWFEQEPTWREAKPSVISDALARAGARPSGNWFVVGASRNIVGGRPYGRTVSGVEVVLWRTRTGDLRAGPGACPHLGAPLREGKVVCGTLVCHWHGLAIKKESFAGWSPFPVHDDGVLVWVRLDEAGGEVPLEHPVLPARPPAALALDSVFTTVGRCEPQDVVANRLDPWHGSWLHPYSFVDLRVVDTPRGGAQDAFAVEVSFRVAGRLVVPVRAVFTAPEPRTVVMHITEGEGATSVVEAHATPLTPRGHHSPRTVVVEAVVAASDRRGFVLARTAAPVLRPLLRRASARLWRDDLAYAERRWSLRRSGLFPG